jgi:TolA-binding protein
MGISLFRLQKFNEAAGLFRDFWIRFPQHPLEESARYAYAWSLVSLGQYEAGRKTFEEVLLTFPRGNLSDPTLWGILKTYLGANEVERATLFYQRFLSHFLSSPWGEKSIFDICQHYFEKGICTGDHDVPAISWGLS